MSAAEIATTAVERETLALCAFDDATAGTVKASYAIAEVIGLDAAERDGALATFLSESHHGRVVLDNFHSFVACVNAYVAVRGRGTKEINTAVLRSAIKWHVQLQRVRAKQFLYAVNAPDDIMSFPGAVSSGHASMEGIFRQASLSKSHKASSKGSVTSPEPSSMRRPSGLERQATSDSFAARLSHRQLEDEDGASFRQHSQSGSFRMELASTREGEEAHAAEAPAKSEAKSSDSMKKASSRTSVGSSPSMYRSVEMGEEADDEQVPLPSAVVGTFSCHGMDSNMDKINQDCACICYPCAGDEETAAFIVLDGHGEQGDIVSGELLQQLYNRLSGTRHGPRWHADDATLRTQLVDFFEEAHQTLHTYRVDPESGEAPGQRSGAAGVALLLRRGRAIIAHSGDCRAVLGRLDASGQLEHVELTEDHKLELEAERTRIEATGAWIKPAEEEPYYVPARVYQDANNRRLGPGLTMSRSMGDLDADPIGVIATPDVNFHTIDPARDRFIVLASDGVWEFLSSEMVVDIIGGFIDRGEAAVTAARFLIAKAAMAWRIEEGDYRDDITAIVIFLNGLPGGLGVAST